MRLKMSSAKKNQEVKKLVLYTLIGIVVLVGVVFALSRNSFKKEDYTVIKFAEMYQNTQTAKEVSERFQRIKWTKGCAFWLYGRAKSSR